MANEIVRYESLAELQTIAQTFALTGYFDARGTQPVEVAKALTKILAGKEMGIPPFAAMKGIYVINGNTSLSGHLMAVGIKRSGKYDYRVREKTETVCRIEFFERVGDKWESLGIETFSAEDAKRAGTKNMGTYPKNMLFNRCISNGYRTFCPDALGSGAPVYTPEELGAEVNEAGDYVESTARVVDKATGEITEAPARSNGKPQPAPEEVFEAAPLAPWQQWTAPADVYEWAVDNGATFEAAKAAFKVVVGDHFGGKLTTGNKQQAFRWFYEAFMAGEYEQPAMLTDPAAPVGGAAYN